MSSFFVIPIDHFHRLIAQANRRKKEYLTLKTLKLLSLTIKKQFLWPGC
jgi:hypothetical protein